MARTGKTTPERLHYRTEGHLFFSAKDFPVVEKSDLGETRVVSYEPTGGLKERLLAAADERREGRTHENYLRLRALFIEARDKGWSPREIARAARYSPEGVKRALNDNP